jgi:hypothetical protein
LVALGTSWNYWPMIVRPRVGRTEERALRSVIVLRAVGGVPGVGVVGVHWVRSGGCRCGGNL